MKKQIFFISAAIVAMTFTSCEKESSLTENPTFIPTATGDNQAGGGNGNGGGGTGGGNGGGGTGGGNGGGGTGGGNGGGGTGGGLPAGFMADTAAGNRVAVLEDFTGVRCGFCPDGHVVANGIESSLGDDFVAIAVHGGSYAAPAPGWANFTTIFGDALISQANVGGYPAGTLNRMTASDLSVSPQRPNGYAMGRGSWSSAANTVVGMSSPVNIAVSATHDASSSELTVNVDIYYTDDETDANNITVALLQDGLVSKQSGGSPDPNNYVQNHVLRDYITNGQWGEIITDATTKGSVIQKTFTYSVPADYNGTAPTGGGAVVVSDLKVVAFIARGQTDILTAAETHVQ